MSGGPVFDIKGNICGMDIYHIIRKIEIPNQEPVSVSNGVVITVEELKKAIGKYKTKNE